MTITKADLEKAKRLRDEAWAIHAAMKDEFPSGVRTDAQWAAISNAFSLAEFRQFQYDVRVREAERV